MPPAGPEGRRRADQGDGTYRNPIVAGDRPDPTILKDGDDYYLTFSSFLSYPGLVLWHSRDLVSWRPIGTALATNIGSVWAPDLVKVKGRYFLYIPAMGPVYSSIFVIYADRIDGPWSDPIDLEIQGCIDPGHAVGEDGRRYLFFNGIRRIALSDDGLSTVGELEKVYEPWRYPEDWVVEMFAPEGPKVVRHDGWFYLISAVGGTAGPPTSHMVIAARSRSIHGPWEDCTHNPLLRTQSAAEPWWSRGHASLVEGSDGRWWMVYHGYENGFRTLGRQTLLEPMDWHEGWPRPLGGDLTLPLSKPTGSTVADTDLSDDFTTDRLGTQWSFFDPGPDERSRLSREAGLLQLRAKGVGPADTSPLTCLVGDRSYRVEVSLNTSAEAGLLLFYSERMYCGLSWSGGALRTYQYGQEHSWIRIPLEADWLRIRMTNREHIVTWHTSLDGVTWTQHPWQMEVSGMHHNVFGGFTSLKVALFSAGEGQSQFRDFRYQGLSDEISGLQRLT